MNKEKISNEEAKKQLDEFLNNPENKKSALDLAIQIHKATDGAWFGMSKLRKIFDVEKEALSMRLSTLLAFGFAVYKNEKNQKLYKIDLDDRAKRQMILDDIEFHKAQIAKLEKKLLNLN